MGDFSLTGLVVGESGILTKWNRSHFGSGHRGDR